MTTSNKHKREAMERVAVYTFINISHAHVHSLDRSMLKERDENSDEDFE